MIELIIKMLGCGKLLTAINALDGYKTYIAGTCKMLSGFVAILGALISFLPHLAEGNGLSGMIAVISGPEFPVAKTAMGAGWYLVLSGFQAISQAHAAEKLAAQVKSSTTVQAINPQPQIPPAR